MSRSSAAGSSLQPARRSSILILARLASADSLLSRAISASMAASRRLRMGLEIQVPANSPATPRATMSVHAVIARSIQMSIVTSFISEHSYRDLVVGVLALLWIVLRRRKAREYLNTVRPAK